MVTPASISIATSNVTYPGAGPSLCDKIFRETPGVVAGGVVPCADASVAINPVTAQIAQDATPAKPRRVSMTDLPVVSGSLSPDLSDDTRHFPTPVSAQKCLSGMCLASGKQDGNGCGALSSLRGAKRRSNPAW